MLVPKRDMRAAQTWAKGLALCCLGLAVTGAKTSNQPVALSCSVEVAPSDSGSGRIGTVAVGASGRLAWTDGRPGQVLVRDGRRRVRAIGRIGSGPGEFRVISNLGWLGDTVWVGDGSLPRVQFFNDTGKYLRGVMAATPASWAASPSGSLVGFARRRIASDLPFAVLRQRPQGLDSVVSWPLVSAPRVMLQNGGPRGSPQPFAPETVVGASPNHSKFCAARPTGDAWQLECVDDAAKLLQRTRLSLSGRRLGNALFDSAVVVFSQGRDASEVRRQLSRPQELPAINDILVSDNGDVWLQRTHRFERAATWQRITRDGRQGREMAVAPLSRVLLVTADTVWGTSANADGVESLLRCSIPPV